MKIWFTTFYIFILQAFFIRGIYSQETVTDYDGNVYNTVTIGEQIWLKENLKSLHYCDGAVIPGVVAYNDDDSLGTIYGLLYPWEAAMNGSNIPGAQGVCPCDYHVPTDQEWTILENYLGGSAIAGGEMKETGTAHWQSPNTGATNSSEFTGLPAGEYDAYYNPNKFWLLHLAAVFWTSIQTNQWQALERYLSHDDAACGRLAWYKVMKYSIRCIKDTPNDIESGSNQIRDYELHQNYPNPFNPGTTIKYSIPESGFTTIRVYNLLGSEIATLVNEFKHQGIYEVNFTSAEIPSGVYFYSMEANSFREMKKMILQK